MKVTTNENGVIQLEEVFSGIALKTRDGEIMGICMRDSGFEFNYQGKWYSAQQGVITPMDEEKQIADSYQNGMIEQETFKSE